MKETLVFTLSGHKNQNALLKFMRNRISHSRQYEWGTNQFPVARESLATVEVIGQVVDLRDDRERPGNVYDVYDIASVTRIEIETSTGSVIRFERHDETYFAFEVATETDGASFFVAEDGVALETFRAEVDTADEADYLRLREKFRHFLGEIVLKQAA